MTRIVAYTTVFACPLDGNAQGYSSPNAEDDPRLFFEVNCLHTYGRSIMASLFKRLVFIKPIQVLPCSTCVPCFRIEGIRHEKAVDRQNCNLAREVDKATACNI